MSTILTIILLGIVEGVTEFLPVSSTGHLILAGALLGYDENHWKVFNVVIQFGAILAVIVVYWRTFLAVIMGLLRRDLAGTIQEPPRSRLRRRRRHRPRLRHLLRRRFGGDPLVHWHRLAPRLRPLRLVSDRRRRRGFGLAAGALGKAERHR